MKKYILILLLFLFVLIIGCTSTKIVEKIVEVPYNCSANGYITYDDASKILNDILLNYSKNNPNFKSVTPEDFVPK